MSNSDIYAHYVEPLGKQPPHKLQIGKLYRCREFITAWTDRGLSRKEDNSKNENGVYTWKIVYNDLQKAESVLILSQETCVESSGGKYYIIHRIKVLTSDGIVGVIRIDDLWCRQAFPEPLLAPR